MTNSGFNRLLTILAVFTSSMGSWLLIGHGHLFVGDLTMLSAQEQIVQLKQGTLVVVLPSEKQKLSLLRQALSEPLREKRRWAIQKLHNQTLMERDSFQQALKEAFDRHYTFSKYIFIEDIDLKQDSISTLTRFEYIDPLGLASGSDPYFFLRRGRTESGADALIVMNHLQKPLSRPFPYYVRITRFSSFFDAFFARKHIPWKNLEMVISKLNKKLDTFYSQLH